MYVFVIMQGHVTLNYISFVVDMTSTHDEEQWQEMFEMSTLKYECAFSMMHLNFWRR